MIITDWKLESKATTNTTHTFKSSSIYKVKAIENFILYRKTAQMGNYFTTKTRVTKVKHWYYFSLHNHSQNDL